MGCRSSSVGIVTVYGLDDQGVGVQFLAGAKKFLLCTGSRRAPELTDFKNEWSYTSTIRYILPTSMVVPLSRRIWFETPNVPGFSGLKNTTFLTTRTNILSL